MPIQPMLVQPFDAPVSRVIAPRVVIGLRRPWRPIRISAISTGSPTMKMQAR